jgi:hypothetical protein
MYKAACESCKLKVLEYKGQVNSHFEEGNGPEPNQDVSRNYGAPLGKSSGMKVYSYDQRSAVREMYKSSNSQDMPALKAMDQHNEEVYKCFSLAQDTEALEMFQRNLEDNKTYQLTPFHAKVFGF